MGDARVQLLLHRNLMRLSCAFAFIRRKFLDGNPLLKQLVNLLERAAFHLGEEEIKEYERHNVGSRPDPTVFHAPAQRFRVDEIGGAECDEPCSTLVRLFFFSFFFFARLFRIRFPKVGRYICVGVGFPSGKKEETRLTGKDIVNPRGN